MNISRITDVLGVAHATGDNVLMSGVHGLGKTAIVKQFAEDNNYHFECLIMSLCEPSDLMGMPYIPEGSTSTHFAEPAWLTRCKVASAQNKHCVILLDELNRAPRDVLGASLTLILDRRLNDHVLPELNGLKTLMIAAINPDNDDYQVNSLDPALIDRFAFYNVEVDVQGWLKWARSVNVNGIVRDFIAENPTKLHFIANAQDEIGATPRSWTMLGKYMDVIKNIDPELHFEVIKSKIGSALGSQFYNFFLKYANVVKVDDVEKFVKKQKDISIDNIESVASALYEEKLHNIETVTQMELIHQMADKYFKKATERKDILPLLVMLYAVNIETLASVLKDYKASRSVDYKKLAEWDFDKSLFRKITTKIVA
jgi:hypothetical protein